MKVAHVAIASAALLGISYAIAQTQHSQAGAPCNPCTVFVMVPDGCGGGIVVAPDPVHIKGGSATITWDVVSPGWTIDAKAGINTFKGSGTFTPAAKAPTSTSLPLNFKASPPQTVYKYDITLMGKSGPCTRDPTIVIH